VIFRHVEIVEQFVRSQAGVVEWCFVAIDTVHSPDEIVGHFVRSHRDCNKAFVCCDKSAMGTIIDWIAEVDKEPPKCSIFLAATKRDLLSLEECTILTDRSKAAGSQVGCWFTSAHTVSGVKELFMSAIQKIG
jgi:hypothetical protein